jgi:hypothetical protein
MANFHPPLVLVDGRDSVHSDLTSSELVVYSPQHMRAQRVLITGSQLHNRS